jgi:hypothetical protein
MLTYMGETRPMTEWAEIYDIHVNTIRSRHIYRGWSLEETFSTPVDDPAPYTADTLITYKEKTLSVLDWSQDTGISQKAIIARLRRGWVAEKILTTPEPTRREPKNASFLTYNGKTMRLADWAKEAGLKRVTITARLRKGWSVEKALTTSVDPLDSPDRHTVITHDGRSMILADWAAEVGIHRATISRRLKAGWSVERALTTPVPIRSRAKEVSGIYAA